MSDNVDNMTQGPSEVVPKPFSDTSEESGKVEGFIVSVIEAASSNGSSCPTSPTPAITAIDHRSLPTISLEPPSPRRMELVDKSLGSLSLNSSIDSRSNSRNSLHPIHPLKRKDKFVPRKKKTAVLPPLSPRDLGGLRERSMSVGHDGSSKRSQQISAFHLHKPFSKYVRSVENPSESKTTTLLGANSTFTSFPKVPRGDLIQIQEHGEKPLSGGPLHPLQRRDGEHQQEEVGDEPYRDTMLLKTMPLKRGNLQSMNRSVLEHHEHDYDNGQLNVHHYHHHSHFHHYCQSPQDEEIRSPYSFGPPSDKPLKQQQHSQNHSGYVDDDRGQENEPLLAQQGQNEKPDENDNPNVQSPRPGTHDLSFYKNFSATRPSSRTKSLWSSNGATTNQRRDSPLQTCKGKKSRSTPVKLDVLSNHGDYTHPHRRHQGAPNPFNYYGCTCNGLCELPCNCCCDECCCSRQYTNVCDVPIPAPKNHTHSCHSSQRDKQSRILSMGRSRSLESIGQHALEREILQVDDDINSHLLAVDNDMVSHLDVSSSTDSDYDGKENEWDDDIGRDDLDETLMDKQYTGQTHLHSPYDQGHGPDDDNRPGSLYFHGNSQDHTMDGNNSSHRQGTERSIVILRRKPTSTHPSGNGMRIATGEIRPTPVVQENEGKNSHLTLQPSTATMTVTVDTMSLFLDAVHVQMMGNRE